MDAVGDCGAVEHPIHGGFVEQIPRTGLTAARSSGVGCRRCSGNSTRSWPGGREWTMPTFEILTRRLERLEQQNRLIRRTGAGLGVAVLAFLLMGQASPGGQVVEAQRF